MITEGVYDMEIAFWSNHREGEMDILPDQVMGYVPTTALGDLIIALQSGDEDEMRRVAKEAKE